MQMKMHEVMCIQPNMQVRITITEFKGNSKDCGACLHATNENSHLHRGTDLARFLSFQIFCESPILVGPAGRATATASDAPAPGVRQLIEAAIL